MASQNPFPIMPPKSTELRLLHFDEYIYTATPSTNLYRFVDALCGTSGAGALVNEIFLARMAGSLETIYFNDLDYIFSKVSFLSRSPAESYTYNPMIDMLTSDQWDEVRRKDAWYRARIRGFFQACNLGGTPDGIRMCVHAALAVDCDIYEVWRYMDNFSIVDDLGRAPQSARNEVVIRPHKSALLPEELRLVRDMLGKLLPMETIVTVNTSGLSVMSPIKVNAAASDSTYYEVQKMVTATPVIANLPPPELLPVDLLPSEQWLYQAQLDPTLAPYTAFNITQEYGYYYLVGGGNRSPIDSVTYGTINPDRPVKIAVFEVGGTYRLVGDIPLGVSTGDWFSQNLDPNYFQWVPIPYGGDIFPIGKSIQGGVNYLVNAINAWTGPFILVGYSQGGGVVSNVYDMIRYGGLQHRKLDFLAGVTFGSTRRQGGHTFPGCPDPGGRGIDGDHLLSDTQDIWWDFAVPGDPITTQPNNVIGSWATAAYNLLLEDWMGGISDIIGLLGNPFEALGNIIAMGQSIINFLAGAYAHGMYFTHAPLPGDERNCLEIARDYIGGYALQDLNAFTKKRNEIAAGVPLPPYYRNAGKPPRITVFWVPYTYQINGNVFSDPTNTILRDGLDPTHFEYVQIAYPGNLYPMNASVDAGVNMLTMAIRHTLGPFIIAGGSQGAIVASRVYDKIRSGELQDRRTDFLGGFTFGNPCRAEGHTFPGCPDPGGHGILTSGLLVNPDDIWWDFALPGDVVTVVGDDAEGLNLSYLFDILFNRYDGTVESILRFAFDPIGNVLALINGLIYAFTGSAADGAPHVSYPFRTIIPGDDRNCLQIAIDKINSMALPNLQYTIPIDSNTITVYEVGEAGLTSTYFRDNLDPKLRYTKIECPSITPPQGAINMGISILTKMINKNPGKFAFVGTGLGAIITSRVYEDLRDGSLHHRQADFFGAVAFGNPRRQAGHTFPGGPVMTGQGISEDRLSDTENLWWDFAAPQDTLGNNPGGSAGEEMTEVFEAYLASYTGKNSDVLARFPDDLVSNRPADLDYILAAINNGEVMNPGASAEIQIFNWHHRYHLYQPLLNSGDQRNAFKIALDYLNSLIPGAVSIPSAIPDVMETYQVEANYQMLSTTGQMTAPTPYEKADSPDNYPGGKRGLHPAYAPALNPDGTAYIFPYPSQAAFVTYWSAHVLSLGGTANGDTYQLPIQSASSSAMAFLPNYAIAYSPPAKDSTISASITRRHGDPNGQLVPDARNPVNFVR